MEWLERMNRAVDYIEANLAGEIEMSEVARVACSSSYQFQRMFSFITEVTLAEYIRAETVDACSAGTSAGQISKGDRYRDEIWI